MSWRPQADLFGKPTQRLVLIERDGCRVSILRGCIADTAMLDAALAFFLASKDPQPDVFRNVPTHRRSAGYGAAGTTYSYANQTKRVLTPPTQLRDVAAAARKALGNTLLPPFNFCLVNVYTNGHAQLGWHHDQEHALVPGAPIMSVSLGADRSFEMRSQSSVDERPEFSWELGHGDILLMEGETQQRFVHRVPAQPSRKEPRVNLTFRVVKNSRTGGLA